MKTYRHTASNEPHATFKDVTPLIAEYWIGKMGANRRVEGGRVSTYARDMMAGLWRPNNDAICFNTEGRLINGQHRLLAVMETGLKVRMLIQTGLPEESMRVIDRARPRSFATTCELEMGMKNHVAVAVAAITRMCLSADMSSGDPHAGLRGHRPSEDELLRTLNAHHGVRTSAEIVTAGSWPKGLVRKGSAGFVHYCGSRFAPEQATEFIEALRTGRGLLGAEPVFLLRDRFIRDRMGNPSTGVIAKMADRHKLELLIRAWNHTILKTPIARLQIGRTFPMAYGGPWSGK